MQFYLILFTLLFTYDLSYYRIDLSCTFEMYKHLFNLIVFCFLSWIQINNK